ncbi:hypothetical protein [Sporichthya sp.]|uniref:hypothetical protein n=1 Tax=Sporichthya sp. TaxID=65475 RepID=UPI0025E2BDFA|nr:hypothetical protein [Sporichthya sp.]
MAIHATASLASRELAAGDLTAPAVPWQIRALESDALLAALRSYGLHHCASEATGVQVMLRGDTEAAELIGSLVRDGVRVVALQPAALTPGDARPGVIAGFATHDGLVPVTQHHQCDEA